MLVCGTAASICDEGVGYHWGQLVAQVSHRGICASIWGSRCCTAMFVIRVRSLEESWLSQTSTSRGTALKAEALGAVISIGACS